MCKINFTSKQLVVSYVDLSNVDPNSEMDFRVTCIAGDSKRKIECIKRALKKRENTVASLLYYIAIVQASVKIQSPKMA